MDRLTYRDKDGMAMMKERGGWKSGGIDRLATYEDTGREPEEIELIVDTYGRGHTLRTESAERLEIVREIKTDRLRELMQGEKDGTVVANKASPGGQVWIIERDDCGDPYEISGYMFLASTGNAVIVTAYINSLEDLEETLGYHIQETAENYETDLAVFPEEDCYLTREEADAALKGGEG